MAIGVYSSPSVSNCARAPILVLFHGRGADESQWLNGSLLSPGVGIDAIAQRLVDGGAIPPLTIVSARIDDSYGVDSASADDGYAHGPYERYISDELLPTVAQRFGAERPLYVGGLSMGAYAALNVALDNPGRFAGVGALSPAFFVSPPSDRACMYSPNGRTSLFERADAGSADGLRIFLGDGERDYDWIRAATKRFGDQLIGRGVNVQVEQAAGGHEVGTWRALSEPMLRFLFDGWSCS
jgi:enterochelin esterase-like enzyme